MSGPVFPPLFRGEAVPRGADPMEKAIASAALGIDAGLVFYDLDAKTLRAAIVLAPETALGEAMAMVLAAANGFSDALGALAPPEVAVHMEWPGTIRVNGARCGEIVAAASVRDPEAHPDWLVIGLTLAIDFGPDAEPGEDPDRTALWLEGCRDVEPLRLLEAWTRHFLYWITTWEDGGMAKVHADWRGRAHKLGEDVTVALPGRTEAGTFVGLDEAGGLLLRQGGETKLLSLSEMLRD